MTDFLLPYIDDEGCIPIHFLGFVRKELSLRGLLSPSVNSFVTRMIAVKRPAMEIMEVLGGNESKSEAPRFSYVMAKVPDDLAEICLSFPIDPLDFKADEDMANVDGGGRELEPHITVKYGLTDDNPAAVDSQLQSLLPFTVYPEPITSLFQHEHQDVLIVRVDEGPVLNYSLRQAHERLNALPHADTYAEYKPHITIAYLQPGQGKNYMEQWIDLRPFVVDRLIYIDPDKNRMELFGRDSIG